MVIELLFSWGLIEIHKVDKVEYYLVVNDSLSFEKNKKFLFILTKRDIKLL